jgi:hypothetical protein
MFVVSNESGQSLNGIKLRNMAIVTLWAGPPYILDIRIKAMSPSL